MKQILKLRAELEITAPQAGPSSEWSAASELAEVEKLAEMGVILRPAESASAKLKEKAKLKALPVGHVLFVEERKDCKLRRLSTVLTKQLNLSARKLPKGSAPTNTEKRQPISVGSSRYQRSGPKLQSLPLSPPDLSGTHS